MLIEAIILSLIVGKIRKGQWKNFAYVPLRGMYFFVIGALLQGALFILADGEAEGPHRWLFDHFYWLHLGTYGLILLPLGMNRQWWGFRWMALGTLLNLIPIAANSGKMPVKVPEGYPPIFDMGHSLLTEATRVKFLGDVLFLGPPYPRPGVMSIGDVVMVIGVFWFIQQVMTTKVHTD